MRILHVTDVYRPRVGGIEIFVEDLARRQLAAGHDVTVLTSTPGVEGLDEGVQVLRSRQTVFAPYPVLAGRREVLSGEYDVVHVHLSVVSPFATAVARSAARAGIPTVHTVHSMWNGRGFWVRIVRALADWDSGRAAWTAVSSVAARDITAVVLPGTPVHVVPNAVDVDWWEHVPSGRAGREAAQSAGAEGVTLVSVMRLAGRKRPIQYVRILDRVRRAVPAHVPLTAVLIGDGPLADRVQREITRHGLGDWVTLAGRLDREQIRATYADADVYVAPAFQESFGIAALEARAAGLPVVAMSSGGVGEFIVDGVEGMLCADDAAMADALVELVTDTVRRRRMKEHNLRVPPAQDWPAVLSGFEAAYAEAGADVPAPVTPVVVVAEPIRMGIGRP